MIRNQYYPIKTNVIMRKQVLQGYSYGLKFFMSSVWQGLLCAIILSSYAAQAQNDTVGIFPHHQDIGHPKRSGSAQYEKVTHTYRLKGSGYNIWFNRDEFHYAYKQINGDFTATANFEFKGGAGNGHRKVGWMLRASTDESDIHISAVDHGDGLTVLQWRSKKGANMLDPEEEIFFPEKNFEVVQLQRIGKIIIMRVGHVGEPLKTVGSHSMPNMPAGALLGLFICSHDPEVTEEATAWDVHLDTPDAKK
jgi:TolB protein